MNLRTIANKCRDFLTQQVTNPLTVRGKLILLLRELEREGSYINDCYDFDTNVWGDDCTVEDQFKFPNYTLIIKRFSDKYQLMDDGIISILPSGRIVGELKRMDMDGLLRIDTQEVTRVFYPAGNDYRPSGKEIFTGESVVLTTRGKNKWEYAWYKAMDNPVTMVISILAFLISIFANLDKLVTVLH